MTELTNLYPETPSAGLELPPGDESKAQLETFIAEATLKYSIKDYEAAAELYSQATELQAQINGELSSRNADLLYAYGRCLYHLALRNSDVLGTKVARETRNEGSKSTAGTKQGKKSKPSELADGQTRITEEALTKVIEDNDGEDSTKEGTKTENKPFFQFTGDENFDDEDEDEEDTNGEEGDEADADDEDDFANAFEVLDLARVLLLKRIEELRTSEGEGAAKGKGKAPPDSQDMLQLKERLADTHDLQAEISLEGERFPAAVVDLRAALALKEELFAHSSSLIAEAHYKLSLALEFSSVTQQKDADGDAEVGAQAHVDEAMREEAAEEMKAAISSCKLRIKEEEATLNFSKDQNPKSKVTKADIEDVKEMVKDMEQRLLELLQPPVSLNDPTGTGTIDGANPLGSILGSILGESPAGQQARLQDASSNATDLTNLVKRKKTGTAATVTIDITDDALSPDEISGAAASPKANGNGKRKFEFAEEVVEVGTGKRARLSEADDI